MANFKNPIVGSEYDKLVFAMRECAKTGNLPQAMEIRDTTNISMKDVHSLIKQFNMDTGLSMRFSAETCPYCDELHTFLFVDYPDEDEQTILQ